MQIEKKYCILNVPMFILFFNSEFLPRVLGPKLMSQFGLKLSELYYEDGYDPECNPNIFNEFATAAFRFAPLFQLYVISKVTI